MSVNDDAYSGCIDMIQVQNKIPTSQSSLINAFVCLLQPVENDCIGKIHLHSTTKTQNKQFSYQALHKLLWVLGELKSSTRTFFFALQTFAAHLVFTLQTFFAVQTFSNITSLQPWLLEMYIHTGTNQFYTAQCMCFYTFEIL